MERDLILTNPQLKKPVLTVLGLFGGANEPQRRSDVEQAVQGLWEGAFRQGPAATIDILVRNGALVQSVFVNGEPYDGTFDDLQTDETVPDDAEAWACVALTETGLALRDAHDPAATLQGLFDERPQYAEVFETVLWACSNDGGCSRMALESQIAGMPQLQPDPQSGRTRVYPQYFIDALESAGGIVWDGAWKATPAGCAVLSAN